ncbi:MAG: LamG domain-containing protein, partial [Nitrososphaeraceae archaeon]|nr:LamG domain-containing protein [Nitrososphaeraceae archaeon]
MKNSDRKNKVLFTGIIIFISYIVLNYFDYPLVNGQTSNTFLTFSGSNFLDVENSEKLQLTKFTVSVWFSTDKRDYINPGMIVNKGGMNEDDRGKNMNYGIWITPTEELEGGFERESGTNIFVTSKGKFNDGNWHHAILTYDGSALTLYVDGKIVGKVNSLRASPDNTGNQPIRIGANSFAKDKFFTGNVDEVMIWDRALSQDEIFNFYNFDDVPLNGLILYLPFSSISPVQSSYKFQPFKTLEGDKLEKIEKDEDIFKLDKFSLATWFRADRIDHDNVGILLNRGGFSSELGGENLNYGIWLNPSETIEGGFETSSGTNVFVSSPDKYNDGLWH